MCSEYFAKVFYPSLIIIRIHGSITVQRDFVSTIYIAIYVIYSSSVTLSHDSIDDKPFSGVVQRIILNEKPCNLSSGLSQEVARYRGAPCGYTPCLNGGTCFPVLSRFLCHCGPRHFGALCEHSTYLLKRSSTVYTCTKGRKVL